MDAMTLEINIGSVRSSAGSGSLLFSLRIGNDGSSQLQIFAHDPSDRRKTGTLLWLDPKQYRELKDVISKTDNIIESLQNGKRKDGATITDLLEGLPGPPRFQRGDRVRVTDGPFENFEGVVTDVMEASRTFKVMLAIFNRDTVVELEASQLMPSVA